MLQLVSKITITQSPSKEYPDRGQVFVITFCIDIEIDSSWENLTDTAKVILPNKSYFKNSNGDLISWFGSNIYGQQTTPPLLLRGDGIKIEMGYIYPDYKNDGAYVLETYVEFIGYITNIHNSVPIQIECEDEMYRLKLIPCPKKVWSGKKYTLQSILQEMLVGTGISVDDGGAKLNLGDFPTGFENESICDMLKDLRKSNVDAYFRIIDGRPVLRCSGLVYFPADRRDFVFHRQKNVIDDDLQYVREDDQNIGVKAYSITEYQDGVRRDGNPKIKKKRLEVLVPDGLINGAIRTYHFWNISSQSELKKLATEALNKIYFEGFRGEITAFGLPSTRHGDAVIFEDQTKPERNGTYLIKSVKKKFGQNGYRQHIEMDRRIDKLPNEVNASPQ